MSQGRSTGRPADPRPRGATGSKAVRRWVIGAVAAVFALGVGLGSAPAQQLPPVPRLTWYGQSCFLLETAQGTRVLMDPTSHGAGFRLPDAVPADLVTVSHEHPDHTNLGLVSGTPRVLRGLTPDKKGWLKIDERFRDVSIRTIGVYHDDELGTRRGLNAIFVFETSGVRVAHLGDLGHTLTDQQLSELGQVDVVLVPVGGTYTIDAERAARVVDQIRPRLIVVPMHYKTETSAVKELAPVDVFTSGRPHVRKVEGNMVAVRSLKSRPGAEVVVLSPP
ncbi:MAG: MBL fold metallo-hydrolase [Myxococcales bacterium]|nr:MBL fold metallo-hydrolase [Myxococcales bacterium]